MIEICEALKDDLPPEALEGLKTARQYWAGIASAEDLERMRVVCWAVADTIPSPKREEQPYRYLRAVICCLYSKSNDLEDLLQFFVDLIDGDEQMIAAQTEVLTRIFPECLRKPGSDAL
ncbi:MAG: hypothetical protein HC897_11830 [Thermoanaerobaculia bacterium]|nr:hypothetical protein [Thermoanaerobaculia bacterium]